MTDGTAKVWDLIDKIDFCMLVTTGRSGALRGRPMSSIGKRDENRIYFLTHADAGAKDDEVAASPAVHLGYSNGRAHLSVSGDAALLTDRALIERLWNPGAQAFWPEGPSTPGLTVIAVTPNAAEYWDGPNALVALVKFASALATGNTPDFGDNKKVAF